jgi:hypothetical protein
MRTNRVPSAIFAVAFLVLAAGCTYEQSSQLILPAAPSAPGLPTNPSDPGSLAGTWASLTPLDLSSWSCGEFQWNISEQTPTSLAGSFSGICSGIVLISGTASGQRNGDNVTISVNGTASLAGDIATCPLSLNGRGHIEDEYTMTVVYEGTTCLGPVNGEEVLRRPSPDAPPEPEPEPPPPPAPPSNPNHVGPGALTAARAKKVVEATGAEFPHLLAAYPTESASRKAAEQLLLRTIWHLQQAGFDARRQRNPSRAISNDKLTIFIGGSWHAYDIFRAYGTPNQPTKVIFIEVFPADPIAYPGIPD